MLVVLFIFIYNNTQLTMISLFEYLQNNLISICEVKNNVINIY